MVKSILTGVLLLSTATASTASQPNVIVVITDDQGYGDLSCHGNPVLCPLGRLLPARGRMKRRWPKAAFPGTFGSRNRSNLPSISSMSPSKENTVRYTVSVNDQHFSADIETQPKLDSDKKVRYIPPHAWNR